MKKLLLSLTILISFSALAQPPAYVPTNGLVGWWPFSGNADDESVNTNNGTVNGATLTTDRFGTANAAYDFDGVDDYILIPDHPDYTFGTIDFTVSYWAYKLDTIHVNPNHNNQGVNVWNGGASPGTNEWVLHHSGTGTNYANYIIESGTTSYQLISTTNLVISTWYHILGLRDNDSLHLYINGTKESSLFIGNISVNNVGDDMLCAALDPSFAPGTTFSNVILDDIGIWNRALTECEIQDLYNASVGSVSTVTQTGATLTAEQSGATYQWLDCDNSYAVIAAETNQSYTPTNVTGNYAVEVTLNGCVDTSACYHVDFTGIEQLANTKKELIKIIDFMGRETEFKPNTPLIFIYSDGTRERVMEIEE